MKKIIVVITVIVIAIAALICVGNTIILKIEKNNIIKGLGADNYKNYDTELVFDSHEGTSDGEALYVIKLEEGDEFDVSDWKGLPISKKISEVYIDGVDYPEVRKLTEIKNGSWKMIGRNPEIGFGEQGIYGNIKLYVYDSDSRIIYCYIFDS